MIIDILGDSITEGALATCYENTYVYKLGQLLNCEVINHGISGTRIARQVHTSIYNTKFDLDYCLRVQTLDKNADYIVVFGGTNDFGHGDAPIGNKEDDTPDTFYGAVNYLCRHLLDNYKKEQITFIIPFPRLDMNNVYGDGSKKEPSLTLQGYNDIIKEVLNKYGITYLDFKDEFADPAGDLFGDGLHPNDKGHAKLASLLADYFNKIK